MIVSSGIPFSSGVNGKNPPAAMRYRPNSSASLTRRRSKIVVPHHPSLLPLPGQAFFMPPWLSQRAMAAARLAKLKGGRPLAETSPVGGVSQSEAKTRDEAAERAMVGARMANLIHGEPGGEVNAPMGALKPAVTIERAAELSGSSRRNIQRAVTHGLHRPPCPRARGSTAR